MSTDVCIIGGGIAGNYLACLLRDLNIECIVVEKKKSFEDRPLQCAGIISQKILDIVDFPEEIILNRVKIADIYAPNLTNIEMYGKERPIVIDRIAFDTYFGKKAIQKGANYLFSERYITHGKKKVEKVKDYAEENLKSIEKFPFLVKTNNRWIKTKFVVGADGPRSKVGKTIGIQYDYIPAAQARINLPYSSKKTAMYFHPRWKELFGYIVPEGKNGVCRIGLATKNKPNQAFREFLFLLGIKNEQIIDRQGGLIPYGFPKEIIGQGTVLLGDSACMVKATTGGGIVMLMTAAKTLAPSIKLALEQNDYSSRFLRKHYQNKIKRGFIGIQLKIHYFIRLLLAQLKEYDFKYFFKIYSNTTLKNDIHEYADMDFPLQLARKLLKNRFFIRFLIHIGFRNLNLIPKYIKAIAL